MSSQLSRSEAVIEDYKKRKLARSALRRIHELLHAFERERALDRKMARIGVVLLVLLLLSALYWLSGGERVILR